MRSFHRILRKTKAVTSPGKIAGETKSEYQKRYMNWWLNNNVDPELLALADAQNKGDTNGSLVEYQQGYVPKDSSS